MTDSCAVLVFFMASPEMSFPFLKLRDTSVVDYDWEQNEQKCDNNMIQLGAMIK